MEKYGFVYIWFDRKRKMYYIGAHWGYENDGYICSSRHMRNAYARRPLDFKRRILKTNLDRGDIVFEENKILHMIKQEELGRKYYNRKTHGQGYRGFISDETREKNRQASLEQWKDPEKRKRCVDATRLAMQKENVLSKMRGRTMSDEQKQKISVLKKGISWVDFTPDVRKKISEAHLGKPKSAETKQKMSNSRKGIEYSIETKEKMRKSALNRWKKEKKME